MSQYDDDDDYMDAEFETIEGGGGDGPSLSEYAGYGTVILLVLVGALAAYTSYFTVEAGQVGIVVRFGRFQQEVSPGLHFKLPLGVDQVMRVPVERRQKMEFGFLTERAGVQTQYAPRSRVREEVSAMLTGDQNIALVKWVVQFQIRDAKAYLFNVRDPEDTIRDASECAMRQIIGDRSVNELFTTGRAEVASESRDLLQEILNRYKSGINVVTVELQDVSPPTTVAPAFNAVNQAQQERDQKRNEGMRAYQQAIPQAEGEAKKQLAAAEGYRVERVNRATGEVAEYAAIYAEYKKAPTIMRQRMYLEMAEKVLPRVKKKYLMEKGSGTLPLLNLNGGAAR